MTALALVCDRTRVCVCVMASKWILSGRAGTEPKGAGVYTSHHQPGGKNMFVLLLLHWHCFVSSACLYIYIYILFFLMRLYTCNLCDCSWPEAALVMAWGRTRHGLRPHFVLLLCIYMTIYMYVYIYIYIYRCEILLRFMARGRTRHGLRPHWSWPAAAL